MNNTIILSFDNITGHVLKARSDAIGQHQWSRVPNVSTHHFTGGRLTFTFSAVADGDTVYVLTWWGKVYMIKPFIERSIWEECPDLKYGHGPEPAASVFGGEIYVCGGGWQRAKWIGRTRKKAPRLSRMCEVLDTSCENPQWEKIAKLGRAKRRNSVIGVGDAIYCIGGLGRADTVTSVESDEEFQNCRVKALKDVEVYYPDTDTWVKKAPLITARVAPGVAKHDKWIFVLGGLSETGRYLDTIEVYNTDTSVWQNLICRMQIPRMKFVASYTENEIVIVGGEGRKSRSIEKIKVETTAESPTLDNGIHTACFEARFINRMATVFMSCPIVFESIECDA